MFNSTYAGHLIIFYYNFFPSGSRSICFRTAVWSAARAARSACPRVRPVGQQMRGCRGSLQSGQDNWSAGRRSASAWHDAGASAWHDAGPSAWNDAGASAWHDAGPSTWNNAGASARNDARASAWHDGGTPCRRPRPRIHPCARSHSGLPVSLLNLLMFMYI